MKEEFKSNRVVLTEKLLKICPEVELIAFLFDQNLISKENHPELINESLKHKNNYEITKYLINEQRYDVKNIPEK